MILTMPLCFLLNFYRDSIFLDLETKIWSPFPLQYAVLMHLFCPYSPPAHTLLIFTCIFLLFCLFPFSMTLCLFLSPSPPGQTALADHHPYPLTVQPCYVVYLAVNLSSDKERPSRVPAACWGCGLLARALDGFRKILACRNSSQG